MSNSQSLINLLVMQVNNFQKIISSDIFQSSFINEKLEVLDLWFNRVLFSSLINKERDLRERVIKISNVEFRSRSEHNRLMKKLKIKADLFKDLSDTASRQKRVIWSEIKNLHFKRSASASAKVMKHLELSISALIKTSMLTISAAEYISWLNASEIISSHSQRDFVRSSHS